MFVLVDGKDPVKLPLASSAFLTPLTPNQQTQPQPERLIIFTLRRRPLNCGLLGIRNTEP